MRRIAAIAVIATLFVGVTAADAWAKPGRDAGAKMRGEFGRTAVAQQKLNSRSSYRAPQTYYSNNSGAPSCIAQPQQSWRFWRVVR